MQTLPKERRARVLRNGRSRAVRIPVDFNLDADEVVLRQESDGLITIRPAKRSELAMLLAALKPLDEVDRMPEIDDDDLLPLHDDRL